MSSRIRNPEPHHPFFALSFFSAGPIPSRRCPLMNSYNLSAAGCHRPARAVWMIPSSDFAA